MKKVLKYIIAVIMLASVGIGSMTLASAGAVRLSVFNMIKMGTVEKGDGGILQGLMDTFLSYIEEYAYILLVFLGVIVIVAVLTAALPVKAAYIVSIAGQAAINVFACILYIQMRRFVSSIQGAVEGVKGFFGLGALTDIGRIEMHYLPVILWIVLYFLTLVMAVIGLVMKEEQSGQKRTEDILPENIGRGGSVYLNRIQELEENRKRAEDSRVAGSPYPAGNREITWQRNAPPRMPAPKREAAPYVPADRQTRQEFGGALLGESGRFASMAYPMRERVPVYFYREERGVVVVPEQEYGREMMASVYYVDEYQEYCVEPAQKRMIFLESGQPLGAGREYYLPRGMRIYLINREQMFTLA